MKKEKSVYVVLRHTKEQTIIMGAVNTREEAKIMLSVIIEKYNYNGKWGTKMKYNVNDGYYEIVWCPIY